MPGRSPLQPVRLRSYELRRDSLPRFAGEGWCGRPDLNRHEPFSPTDFKSYIRKYNYLFLLAFYPTTGASVLGNVLNFAPSNLECHAV